MILNENINKMKMTKVRIGHTGKKKKKPPRLEIGKVVQAI